LDEIGAKRRFRDLVINETVEQFCSFRDQSGFTKGMAGLNRKRPNLPPGTGVGPLQLSSVLQ
jgi:hypothetical protein